MSAKTVRVRIAVAVNRLGEWNSAVGIKAKILILRNRAWKGDYILGSPRLIPFRSGRKVF